MAVLAFPGAAWSSAVRLCHLPEAALRLHLPARAPQTFLRVGVGRAPVLRAANRKGFVPKRSAATHALLAPRTALARQAEPRLGVFPMTSGCLPGPRRFSSLWASRVRAVLLCQAPEVRCPEFKFCGGGWRETSPRVPRSSESSTFSGRRLYLLCSIISVVVVLPGWHVHSTGRRQVGFIVVTAVSAGCFCEHGAG